MSDQDHKTHDVAFTPDLSSLQGWTSPCWEILGGSTLSRTIDKIEVIRDKYKLTVTYMETSKQFPAFWKTETVSKTKEFLGRPYAWVSLEDGSFCDIYKVDDALQNKINLLKAQQQLEHDR